ASPLTCTTQAPHWLVSQPTCVPVSPRCSRSSCTNKVRPSTVADAGLPLTVRLTVFCMEPSLTQAFQHPRARCLHRGRGEFRAPPRLGQGGMNLQPHRPRARRVPGTHVVFQPRLAAGTDVDGRDKPGQGVLEKPTR